MNIRDCIKGRRRSVFQLNEDDIVVFLVGPSGSGKSLFVNEVTKNAAIIVDAGLRRSTLAPAAIRCELTTEAKSYLGVSTQRNIVFVDTPSFDASESERAEKEMSVWLSRSRCKSTLVGTIYMHRIESDPVYERVQPHLNTFAFTFPPGFENLPERLHCVLSYEGVISDEKIRHRRDAFKAQLDALLLSRTRGSRLRWRTSLHPELFRQGDHETAWRAVVELFSSRRD